MKAPNDKRTPDLLGDSCDLAGPVPAKPTKAEKAAARVAKYRAAKGLKAITVNLPADVVADFHERRAARGQSANEAIEKLIRQQYLRKR